METRNKGSSRRSPLESIPLIEEVVVKLEPDECATLLPESDDEPLMRRRKRSSPAPKSRSRHRTSRHVQVDPDDLDRHLGKKGNWELEREDEPLFLPGNAVVDSQCRCCLRKLDKSHLLLIERSLKTKMRLVFKVRVHPYDSYPFVCVNCTNLIHALADFREALVKSKILLKQEQAVLNDDSWISPEHLASVAMCRKLVDQHRKHVEAIYEDYQMRLRAADDQEIKETQETEQTVSKEEKVKIAEDIQTAEQTTDIQEEKVEETLSGKNSIASEPCSPLNIKESSDYDDNDEDNSNDEDSEDEDYEPPEEKQFSKTVFSNIKLKTNEATDYNCESQQESIEVIMKRKRGRPRKDGSLSAPKPQTQKKVKKHKNPRLPKPKPEPLDKSARHALCPICGKSVHITAKEAHMNQHSGVQPYKCPFEGCNLTFYGKNYWSRHIKRMHGNNGGVHTNDCDICGKTIRGSLGVLREHQARHALTDKNVVCNVCGQRFWLAKHLKQHMIIHTDLFPYECQYCGKKFKHKASKDTHEKNVHEKKNNFGSVATFSSSEYPQMIPPTGEFE
ncbi:zinc finger protein 37-like isoform X2 [Uranotaenia lowii]|uniref:zinc finger protein 37-like isoform X2 n=1 Tax=Uranotaenia lowii TaxID=190385 RepID=UPI00247B2000|nr:zinc finger protein 37-like isoform X2 [Uranotaenia lowii]